MPVSLQASDFWAFSLRVYPANKASLLQLQDEAGANVNVLLLAMWLNQQQLALTSGQWLVLLNQSKDAAQRVERLRAFRRQLTDKTSSAYQMALAAELDAEKQHQAALIAALAESEWETLVGDNLPAYVQAQKIILSKVHAELLSTLEYCE
ncbi:TIGR02444 family protein [Bowmanella sp. JS7-9]|uniref:TIGR02444 family protein n=1 Tax=Pseudobowmanella zhangzhouensis TaxID=1537679 RepID=A0ABW1XIY8_9ALTE|nr:TIGR02444 family protein [Bowmanella sp. JS7-9]